MTDRPGEQEDTLSVHEGSPDTKGRSTSPWSWIPTANFASGMPYIVVMTLSVIVYKNMGVSNILIGFWTSLLGLAWTIKPLYGPLVDRYWTKRSWIVGMQLLLALCFGAMAVGIQFPTTPLGNSVGSLAISQGVSDLPLFFAVSMIFLSLIAFGSSTQDIATDGYYMLALRERQQAYFVGIRSTFYRLAMIVGTGILPLFAGYIQNHTGLEPVLLPAYLTVEGMPRAELSARAMPGKYDSAASLKAQGQAIVVSPASVSVNPGKTADVMVHLAVAPPEGHDVVVLSGFKKFDKGLGFSQGERLVFNSKNWDQPTTVTVAANATSNSPKNAVLSFSSGNIPLSWGIIFLACGVVFLFFALYHKFILPYPQEDVGTAEGQSNIFKPIFWLLVAIGIPALLIILAYNVMGHFGDPYVVKITTGFSVATMKLFSLLWTNIKLLILVLAIAVAFFAPGVRNPVRNWFRKTSDQSEIGFAEVFGSFFRKQHIGIVISFILLFRLGEALIVKLGPVFLLEVRNKGGLGLSVQELGTIYGIVGLISLLVGGIIGGWLISNFGLKKVIWPLVACMHLPNLVYVYMAYTQPTETWIPTVCVAIEQLGYGIGFASFMMFLISAAQGPYKTAHYALCTGFMSLGMMIPGMWSGYLQGAVGYPIYFILAFVFVLPGVALIPFLPITESFGRKSR